MLKAFIIILLALHGLAEKESEKFGSHYEDGEHNEDYDHQAILGSEDAVEEFSHLSPEEAKERLGKLVDRMDVNKDGKVTQQELLMWIKNSFMNANMEESTERMESDDDNEDGLITWEEYTKNVYAMTPEELDEYKNSDLEDEEAKKLFTKSVNYDKAKFKAADENEDNVLDKHEYAAFIHPYDYPRMTDVEADRVLADYDLNGDGKITWEEFQKNPVFAKKSAEDMIAERENFKYNDLNKDGDFTREEIIKWVAPNLDQVSIDEADHLIQATDKNGDGFLSKDEIVEEHELWVGSEATDYGEFLRDEL